MPRKQPLPLSDAQREIMEIVWDRGEVAASEVRDILSRRRDVARNTVQTLLTRMEEKGWLRHRVVGRTFFYSAAVPREQTRRTAVRELLHSVFEGSAEELMTALLEDVRLSDEEARRIREMIDQATKRKGKRP